MRVLLHSAVVYLFGVALILYVKPTLMFRADGQWKEFGTVSKEHTVFPFWLFCILWAVVSYILMLYLVGENTSVVPLTTSAALAAATATTDTPEDLVPVLPTKTRAKSRTPVPAAKPEPIGAPKPGYYRLNKNALNRTGAPKYIYIGSELDERSDGETDGEE
jgi:hypothetical protein